MCREIFVKFRLAFFILVLFTHLAFAITSANFIYGNGYRGEDHQQWRLSFGHASRYQYGDNFFFAAIQNPTHDGTNMYGEWSSRLSWSKFFQKSFRKGFIKDTLFAGQLNYSGTGFRAYLYGLGFDLDLPYFKFFQFNIYRRRNPNFKDGSYMLHPVWFLPLHYQGINMSYSGFIDYTGSENNLKVHLLSRSQLLVNLGELTGKKRNALYLGPRFSYWRHKRGVSGDNDRVLELLIRWRFD